MTIELSRNHSSAARYSEIMRELSKSAATFPDTATIAEFRPWSQTVHLHEVGADLLLESLKSEQLNLCRSGWQTLSHELTHWVDLLTTLWGRDCLLSLADAYDSALNGNERNFHRLIDHFDLDRRVLLPLYYQFVVDNPPQHSVERPWSIEYTSGYEFTCNGHLNEEKPIFFAVFGDHETHQRIARQPLSTGALLEIRAVCSEMATGLQIISGANEEAVVESVVFGKELTGILYSPDLTNYTAPIHLLSARSHTKEPLLSYNIGAELAFISLNMTDELIPLIKHPDQFRPFGARRDAFVANRDRGYIYASLAFHAPPYEGQEGSEFIEETLSAAGLPTKDEVLALARAQLGEAVRLQGDLPPVRAIESLLRIGPNIFDAVTEKGNSLVDLNVILGHSWVLPSFYDRNGHLFSFVDSGPEFHDSNQMLEFEYLARERLQNFLLACRGPSA